MAQIQDAQDADMQAVLAVSADGLAPAEVGAGSDGAFLLAQADVSAVDMASGAAETSAAAPANAAAPSLSWGGIGLAAGGLALAVHHTGDSGGSAPQTPATPQTPAAAQTPAATPTPAATQTPAAEQTPAAQQPPTQETSTPHVPPKLTFDSDGVISAVAENNDVSQPVHTAHATLAGTGTVSYSLMGVDADAFRIDAQIGIVRMLASADYETKTFYSFNVVATSSDGLTATQFVGLGVTDVNEAPVVHTSYAVYVTPDAPQVHFTIPADMFVDPDTTSPNNLLHYYINGGEAPAWTQVADAGFRIPSFLSFDAATGTISGTMPTLPDHSGYSVTLVVGAVDTAPPTYIERTIEGEGPLTYQEIQLAGLSAQQALTFYMHDSPPPVLL